MPQLWIEQDGEGEEWVLFPLADGVDVYYLTGDRDAPVVASTSEATGGPAYVMRHPGRDGRDAWLLFASGQARLTLNGEPMPIAMRALADKDEIRIGECTMFFSAERLAGVVAFPGIGRPCKCPRCHTDIEPGTPAVQCPNCGVWHHQSDDLPCWTYSASCAADLCEHPTSLDEVFRWVPEGL